MRKAYSLIEAVVAVSVLTIIISVGVSIIFVSSDTESTNKDLLIGNTLAAEGAEAIKAIYYTNILKYGEDDLERCGLMQPEAPNDASYCDDPRNYIYKQGGGERYFILNRKFKSDEGTNNLLTWELKQDDQRNVSIAADESLLEDKRFRLRTTLLCKSGACKGDGRIGEIYASYGTTDTKFYREIMTRELADSVQISSRVHWRTLQGNIRTVENSFELPK